MVGGIDALVRPPDYRWRDDFLAAGEAALAGSGGKDAAAQKRRVAELEKEIEKRDQVIGEYTIANRFFKKTFGKVELNSDSRVRLSDLLDEVPAARITSVLAMVGVSPSSWYRQSADPDKRRRPGPAPKLISEETRLDDLGVLAGERDPGTAGMAKAVEIERLAFVVGRQ